MHNHGLVGEGVRGFMQRRVIAPAKPLRRSRRSFSATVLDANFPAAAAHSPRASGAAWGAAA